MTSHQFQGIYRIQCIFKCCCLRYL